MPVTTRSQAKRLVTNYNGCLIIPSREINNSTNMNTIPSTDTSTNKFISSTLVTTDMSSSIITPLVQQSDLSCYDSNHFGNCNDKAFQILKSSTVLSLPRHVSKFLNSLKSHNNIETSLVFKMESDCEDNTSSMNTGSTQVDSTKLFQQLSSQITSQNMVIQEQIKANNQKVLHDFQKLTQDTTDFKQNVKRESDSLRQCLNGGSSSQVPLEGASSSTTQHSNVMQSSAHMVQHSTPVASAPLVPNQIMLLLTDSFAKLSTIIGDKNTESKMEWPKFGGDPKKFRTCPSLHNFLFILRRSSMMHPSMTF
jgi:hypothetical protein